MVDEDKAFSIDWRICVFTYDEERREVRAGDGDAGEKTE